ncbi:uncharacterized protein C8A04DRAFT_28981 [Dichotomopilus funicola]|uniref:4'-phosphopantetheinyl transferase domain-containing protein n=1 Tax=Dichotomopilus funicola TaxID=1934379 RepID=A0AAN6V1X8_9PEZI|nr:hypothetical protein C8A04DRAFT_28981 [Dichotomopilus funicola]
MPPPLPPIPFPYPLRIGTDICRVTRIAHILRSKQGARFIRRILAPEELARARPVIHQVLQAISPGEKEGSRRVGVFGSQKAALWEKGGDGDGEKGGGSGQEKKPVGRVQGAMEDEDGMYGRAAAYMAGRFAAKEAAFKAHPHLHLGFHDILILSSSTSNQALTGEKPIDGLGSAAPTAVIRPGGGARDQIARVSISHDGEYATAVCMGFEADAVVVEKEG